MQVYIVKDTYMIINMMGRQEVNMFYSNTSQDVLRCTNPLWVQSEKRILRISVFQRDVFLSYFAFPK